MTAEEMHIQVNLRSQKINSNVNDDFLPQEIDVYLNRAVNEFISDRLLPESNYLKEGFEQSQKRIDDLRELVKKDQPVPTNEVATNAAVTGYFVDRGDFPADYRHLLSIRLVVQYARENFSYTVTNGSRAADGVENTDYLEEIYSGRFFQSDDVYKALFDPHNTTKPDSPIYDISENGVDAYTNEQFVIPTIIMNYIREPAVIAVDPVNSANNVDCDLAEGVHHEIVDMAVTSMLSDIEKFGPQGLLKDLEDVE